MLEKHKEQKEHWFRRLLRHPLLVAIFSALVFGVLVAWLGATFQHRYWLEQERISRQNIRQEKLFENRAELIRRLSYHFKERELNVWALYLSRKCPEEVDFTGPWKKVGEIRCEDNALRQEILICFGVDEYLGILRSFDQISKIWTPVEQKLTGGNAEVYKSVTPKYIRQKAKEARDLQIKIAKILKEILYEPD